MCRLRGAHVGAHRNEHADIARQPGEDRAHREAAGRRPVERHADGKEENDADYRDGGILPVQVGTGARLNGGGDFLHPGIAGRLLQNPAYRNNAVEDCNHPGCYRKP